MKFWLSDVRWLGVRGGAVLAAMVAASSCGFHHKKYENPITKDTQQPDKVLFDKAIKDLEHGRYELSRLTLNTLINTYDTSEYMAKAKLAIADSWYREGGASGLAQAEADYKDFELFFPTLPEAAESQYKICMIHYKQMEKPDRDATQALRTEQECKQLVLQFPNSKFVPETIQRLREVDEVLAEGEMRTGDMYYKKGAQAAAANRYTGLVDQYPLYSRADEALWKEADAYVRIGSSQRSKAIQAYQKIVRDYPLSEYVDEAKRKLREMEAEVPEADPAAVARMKYEQDNRTKTSMLHNATGFLRPSPDVAMAAKAGTPAMNAPKQEIPVNVPRTASSGQAGFVGDVTVAPATNASVQPAPDKAASVTTDTAAAQGKDQANTKDTKKNDKKNNKKNNKKDQKQNQTPDQAQPAQTPPAAQPQ